MSNPKRIELLEGMLNGIEVPESAYENAIERYEDLCEWFKRPSSTLRDFDPLVDVQGSFAIGTATRPLGGDFDLDLFVVLRRGVDTSTHSQKALVELAARELRAYREARGIQDELEYKHRCLSLNYQGSPGFHMDVVPAIPGSPALNELLFAEAARRGLGDAAFAEHALHITDNTLPQYAEAPSQWPSSNPRGYREWFLSRMRRVRLQDFAEASAQTEEVPVYRRKTPLQRCIQLLKRHRDVAFDGRPEVKPASIILSTLAAEAYDSNTMRTIDDALERIVHRIVAFSNQTRPVLVNPVKANEEFTDRWYSEKGESLDRKGHFQAWANQVQRHVHLLLNSADNQLLESVMFRDWQAPRANDLVKHLGQSAAVAPTILTPISSAAARPWASIDR